MKQVVILEDILVEEMVSLKTETEFMTRQRQSDSTAYFKKILDDLKEKQRENSDLRLVSIERGFLFPATAASQKNLIGLPEDMNGLFFQPPCPVKDEGGGLYFPPTQELIDPIWRDEIKNCLVERKMEVMSGVAAAVAGVGLSTPAEKTVIQEMGAGMLCSFAYLEIRAACVLKMPALAVILSPEAGPESIEFVLRRLAGES